MLIIRARQGVVLIEVLTAMVILGTVAVSVLGYLLTLADTEARSRARLLEMTRAERLLTATVLLTSPELDQRMGMRQTDEFAVWVDRPEPGLYRVGVAPRARPDVELLATLVHRLPPDTSGGAWPVDGVPGARSGR